MGQLYMQYQFPNEPDPTVIPSAKGKNLPNTEEPPNGEDSALEVLEYKKKISSI